MLSLIWQRLLKSNAFPDMAYTIPASVIPCILYAPNWICTDQDVIPSSGMLIVRNVFPVMSLAEISISGLTADT